MIIIFNEVMLSKNCFETVGTWLVTKQVGGLTRIKSTECNQNQVIYSFDAYSSDLWLSYIISETRYKKK